MMAVLARRHGSPEVLQCEELPTPPLTDTEVLIRTEVATVNFADVKARRGEAPHLPIVLGHDVVGTVEVIGSAVTTVATGQRVGAIVWEGAYAEFVAAPAERVVPIPDDVPSTQAAGLVALSTAYNVLTVVGQVRAGDSVLINAAAGGVGSIAIQIARELGARVVIGAIRSANKAHLVEAAGAQPLVTDYGPHHAAKAQALAHGPIDLLIDSVGGKAFESGLESLGPFGRVVSFGHTSGEPAFVSTDVIQRSSLSVFGYRGRNHLGARPATVMDGAKAGLRLLAESRIRIAVGATFPLHRAAEAHRMLESGTSVGKLLLVPGAVPVA